MEIDTAQKSIGIFAYNPNANESNDIAIAPNQTLHASDSNWANNTGNLWKVTKAKGFKLIEDQMGTTSGIEVSPNGKNPASMNLYSAKYGSMILMTMVQFLTSSSLWLLMILVLMVCAAITAVICMCADTVKEP